MRARSRTTACVALALGLLGSLLSAGPAAAAVPDLVRISASTATDSLDTKFVTATCPAGSPALLSAGYKLDGGLGDVVIDDFQLQAGSVTVVAYEADPDYVPNWTLTAYAVCADPPPDLALITVGATFESPDFATLTLTCAAGDVLLSGGFVITGATGEVEVDDVRPNGSTSTAPTALYTSAYEADAYGFDWQLTTYGICADPLPGLVRRSASSDNVPLDFKTVTASCVAGEVLVGSGYELIGGATGEVVVDDVEVNGNASTAPTSVAVDAYREDGYTGEWQLVAYAVCADA